jgi:hypothetical protein
MRLPNRSPRLVSRLAVALVVTTLGLACEKNVQEVRRPGQPRDPYAAIRGAPMGYSGSPNTGAYGTPTAMGRGNVNSGSHSAPSAPSAQARTPGRAINPGGRVNAVGSPTAYSPTDGTRARVPGAAAETPAGMPQAIGGSAWSPTDRR